MPVVTTPQQPYRQPQHTVPPQQAYGPASPGRPAHDRAAYPQSYGREPYGQPSHDRRGQAPPPSSGWSGPNRVPGHTGPQQRIPGHPGPQQAPGRDGSAFGADRSGHAYGRPAPQGYGPAPQQTLAPAAPPHARDAREIPAQPGRQAYPAAAVGRAPKNGLGTTALVLGIIGALFAFIPVIGMIAWPLVILGLIFGVLGIARAGSGRADNRGVAISGTVLSAIGLIICIVWASALGAAVSATAPAGAIGSAAPSTSAGAGDSTAPAAFPGATANDVTGSGGDTLTVGDMQVTASGLTPGESVLGSTLCSTVTYTNTGSTTGTFNGVFDWKLQDPAGAALLTGFSGSSSMLSAGELTPGGRTSGEVCFDNKAGAAGQFVLLYDPMDFSSTRGAWLDEVG